MRLSLPSLTVAAVLLAGCAAPPAPTPGPTPSPAPSPSPTPSPSPSPSPTPTPAPDATGPVARVDLNGPSQLKLFAPTAFTAVPRNAAGVALPDRAVTFTSSDPNVVTVGADGKLTARRLSVAPVVITATSEGRTSEALAVSTYGLELTGGTYNRDPGQPSAQQGMAFYVKFRKIDGAGADTDAPIVLTGPAGFDPSKYALYRLLPGDNRFLPFSNSAQPVVPGEYGATVTVDGETYTARTTVRDTGFLPALADAALDVRGYTPDTFSYTLYGTPDPAMKTIRAALQTNGLTYGLGFYTLGTLPLRGTNVTSIPGGVYLVLAYAFDAPGAALNEYRAVTPNQINSSRVLIGEISLAQIPVGQAARANAAPRVRPTNRVPANAEWNGGTGD